MKLLPSFGKVFDSSWYKPIHLDQLNEVCSIISCNGSQVYYMVLLILIGEYYAVVKKVSCYSDLCFQEGSLPCYLEHKMIGLLF